MLRLLAPALLALLLSAGPASALGGDGAPGQAIMDGGPGSESLFGGTWADLPDGPARRPYLKRLTVVNGASEEVVYEGGPGGTGSTQPGDLTAVISAVNLCKAGQTGGGQCYATPNRVGVAFGYATEQGIGRDLGAPTVPLNQTITPDTVIDAVLGLNALGSTLRWTGAQGDLEGWRTTALSGDAGEVRVRLRPAPVPEIDWSMHPGTGCTATPIFDCDIDRAEGESLGASLVLSLDDTLPTALTGAVFATQRAIMGYLQPGGPPDAPVLDLQMASSHERADGSPQLGTLQAFLPAAGVQALYGIGPEAATELFTATRVGDPGTQAPPVFTAVADGATSSAGLLCTIEDITFSAPTYRVARKPALGGPGPGTQPPPGPGPGTQPPPGPGPGTQPPPDPGAGTQPPPDAPDDAAGPPPSSPIAESAPGSPAARGRVRITQASRRRGLALAITGARAGRATAALLLGTRTVARGSVKVGATGRATLRVRLTGAARRKLRGVRRAKVRVVLPGQAPVLVAVTLR